MSCGSSDLNPVTSRCFFQSSVPDVAAIAALRLRTTNAGAESLPTLMAARPGRERSQLDPDRSGIDRLWYGENRQTILMVSGTWNP